MAKRYIPVGKKSSLTFTGRGGLKVHGDNMPEIMAFRLGGPYTIRGYKVNGVGTGTSFIMGSAELATPIPFVDKLKVGFLQNLRLTFWVDAGTVFNPTISSTLYDRPVHAITAGVGLKINMPGVGPLSLDYGIPLTNPGAYGSKNGYFTFGVGDMMY
ncbi:BamA/TamA family outer membrane protein [bacterium]|nr:BamA/TamA family outer membrane protein [bacterium]